MVVVVVGADGGNGMLVVIGGSRVVARHSERGKKTWQTEKDLGRQHQGMDRPGVRQVPEGSEEQRKMEETNCEFICGAPTTLAIKGEMRQDEMRLSF